MLWRDDKFLEMANSTGVEMHERVVDNSNLVPEIIDTGWDYSKEAGNLMFTEERVVEDS